mgnify:CR=1 FL=1
MRCSRFVMTCCGVSFCLRPADGFFFFFCLETKEKETKRKIQGWTSPGLLRKGRSGAEKRTRSVSLRSNSIFQHRPSIPPLTPLRLGRFFYTPRRFAVGFLFLVFRFVLFAKVLRCWLFAFGFCFVLFFSPRCFAVGFLLCFACKKKSPVYSG